MLRFVRPRPVDRPADLVVNAFARANTIRFDSDALDGPSEHEPRESEVPESDPPKGDSEPPTVPSRYAEEVVHSSELLLEPYGQSPSADTPLTPRVAWLANLPPPLPHEDS